MFDKKPKGKKPGYKMADLAKSRKEKPSYSAKKSGNQSIFKGKVVLD